MNYLYSIVFAIIAFNLIGCSSTQVNTQVKTEKVIPPLEYDKLLFEPVEIPAQNDIYVLTEAQKEAFLAYYHDPLNQNIRGYKRLYQYMDQSLDQFNFRGATLRASESLDQMSGNCLSLAIVTTALAKLVDLDVSYEKVNSAPIYHRHHNLMTLSYHVRTHLHQNELIKKEDGFEFIKRKIIVDYFPNSSNVAGKRVVEDDFVALYYNNLAGDALIQEDYPLALSLLNRALSISPQNPSSLNSLAVLFKQNGDLQQAEKVYRYGMEHTTGSVNLLSNYSMLLEEQGRDQEALALQDKIDGIEDDNPYRWLDLANEYYQREQFYRAIKYYSRAIEVGPYLHELHFGLAKAYHALGQVKKAKIAMEQALSWTYIPEEQHLYQAKLSSFAPTPRDAIHPQE